MALVPAIHSSTPLLTSPVPIFLAVLLIILVTPIVLNKLRIPQVIGLIVAGVTVGPYGFNLLARDMSFEVFGQVGLFYLMFLAGIEIDMYHLKKNLRKGLVFGLYTFIIPLALGAVAAGLLLGLDALTAVLMASMFSAHTLIAYPIVSRLGLTRSAPVVIAIAGTIFTVLGSLIVLAGVVGTFHDGEFRVGGTLKLLGLLVAYCLVLVYAYPRITRWFFKHWNDSILQYVYVLAMMFTAAQLAIWAGIEGVVGAFFAGGYADQCRGGDARLVDAVRGGCDVGCGYVYQVACGVRHAANVRHEQCGTVDDVSAQQRAYGRGARGGDDRLRYEVV